MIVEGWNCREDGGSRLGCELHITQMYAVEWSLADAKDEGAALLEADIGRSMDEIRGQAVGDSSEGSHGAGKHDHGAGGIASAGDAGADVGVGVLVEFGDGSTDEFFCETVAAAQAQLFGEDAKGVFRGDEVDVSDAFVSGEST